MADSHDKEKAQLDELKRLANEVLNELIEEAKIHDAICQALERAGRYWSQASIPGMDLTPGNRIAGMLYSVAMILAGKDPNVPAFDIVPRKKEVKK